MAAAAPANAVKSCGLSGPDSSVPNDATIDLNDDADAPIFVSIPTPRSGNAEPSVFNALDTPPTAPDNCDATID